MSQKPLKLRYIVSATLLGNTLEWYDAAIFGFLAPILIGVFFPFTDIWSFPLLAIFIFASGHILRPLGGLVFGYISDKYGRRITLLATIASISVPTFILGVLPAYASLGITATVLFLAMRILQGLSTGGEFPAVITFLYESASTKQRGFIGSFAFFGVALGVCLGGLDFYFLHSHLKGDSFSLWGWRSMYILGSLLGGIAFWLRYRLRETPVFRDLRISHEIARHPIGLLFRDHKKAMGKLIGVETLETLGFNLTISFLVIYLTTVLGLPLQEAIHLNLIFLASLVIAIPIAGFLASRIGPKKMAMYAAWAYFFLAVPIYGLFEHELLRLAGAIGLGGLVGLYMAPMTSVYCGLFPSRVRNSGLGFALNLAISLIGGFAPVVALGISRYTGVHMVPAYMLMVGSLVSLSTFRYVADHPEK